jgi:hypothetical protein
MNGKKIYSAHKNNATIVLKHALCVDNRISEGKVVILSYIWILNTLSFSTRASDTAKR